MRLHVESSTASRAPRAARTRSSDGHDSRGRERSRSRTSSGRAVMAHADDDHRHVATRSSSVPCSTRRRIARRHARRHSARHALAVAAREAADAAARRASPSARRVAGVEALARSRRGCAPPRRARRPRSRATTSGAARDAWPCVANVPRRGVVGHVHQAIAGAARRARPPRSTARSFGRGDDELRVADVIARTYARRSTECAMPASARSSARQRAARPRARATPPSQRACSPCARPPAPPPTTSTRAPRHRPAAATPLTGTALRRSSPRRGTRRTAAITAAKRHARVDGRAARLPSADDATERDAGHGQPGARRPDDLRHAQLAVGHRVRHGEHDAEREPEPAGDRRRRGSRGRASRAAGRSGRSRRTGAT